MLFRKILRALGQGNTFSRQSIAPSRLSPAGFSRNRRPLRLEPLEDRHMLSITLFVDTDSTATAQDGLDWGHAYSDLQSALTRAAELNSDGFLNNDVDSIWIAEGTYRPTIASYTPTITILPTFTAVSLLSTVVVSTETSDGVDSTGNTESMSDTPVEVTLVTDNNELPIVYESPIYVAWPCDDPARTVTFNLVDGVSLYGGFAGTETSLNERDLSAHQTILSGDLGVLGDASDNAYTVVYCGQDVTAALDGIMITDGNADGSDDSDHSEKNSGGGIFNRGNLTVSNTKIFNNLAISRGGGIYNDGEGRILLERTNVSGNRALYGAGIYSSGYLIIANSTISENTTRSYRRYDHSVIDDNGDLRTFSVCAVSRGFGGGIYNSGTFNASNSTFANNIATQGGGICNYGNSHLEATIFQENKSTYGAGIANHGELEVVNSQFQENLVSCDYESGNDYNGMGAGIYNYNTGTANIGNSLFAENEGHGIMNQGRMVIVNSTITANRASSAAGVYTSDGEGSVLALYNTIVAGNVLCAGAWGFRGNNPDVGGYVIGFNNLIGNGTGLLNLVDGVDGNQIGTAESPIDPMLKSWTGSVTGLTHYALLPGSPAIDAGGYILAVYPSASDTLFTFTTDLYGNARILGDAVDIGAIEAVTSNTAARTYVVASLENTIAEDGVLTFLEAFLAANSNHAVGDAQAGSYLEQDVIQFADGLSGTILVNGELVISDDLRIEGSGVNLITFDAEGQNRVFTIAPDVMATLSGITITGGSADNGGGIYNLGTLAVTDCVISNNIVAESGGGIYNSGVLTITNSSILNNSTPDEYSRLVPFGSSTTCFACRGGGIYNAGGDLTVTNSTIAGNSAVYGGGICNDGGGYGGTLIVTNSTIMDNDAFGICNISILSPVPCGKIELNNSVVAGNALADVITFSPRYTGALPIEDLTGEPSENRLIVISKDNLSSHHYNCQTIGRYCVLVRDYYGGSVSGSNNLIGYTPTEANLVNGEDGNQVGTVDAPIDPRLSELFQFANGQYGCYPLPDSPAIDAGNNDLIPDGITTDIIGNARIYGNTVDIGACESCSAIVFIVADDPLVSEEEVLPKLKNHLTPPINPSPGVATVPRRSALPPRRFFSPTPELTDVVLTEAVSAQPSWSSGDLAAIAKDLQTTSVIKSTAASDAIFSLDLNLYADLD